MVRERARAPGRGRYDRRLSASERARRRRELLSDAARAVLVAGEVLTLESVLRRSGLGRNTFYGHFENVEALQVEATERALQTLSEPRWQPQDSVTPYSAVRSFAEHWAGRLEVHRAQAKLAVLVGRAQLTETLTEDILVLIRRGRRAGVFGAGDDALRAACLGAAIVQALEMALQNDREADRLQALIDDLVLRVLR